MVIARAVECVPPPPPGGVENFTAPQVSINAFAVMHTSSTPVNGAFSLRFCVVAAYALLMLCCLRSCHDYFTAHYILAGEKKWKANNNGWNCSECGVKRTCWGKMVHFVQRAYLNRHGAGANL